MKPRFRLRDLYPLLKETAGVWLAEKTMTLGAALAYYGVFSIGPILVLAVGVAGIWFGPKAAQGALVHELEGTLGHPVAKALEETLANAHNTGSDSGATLVGLVMLLVGAAGVFGQLQDALNTIWKVAPKKNRGVLGFIKDRFLSLSMVFGVAFLLLTSLVVSAFLSSTSSYVHLGVGTAFVWQAVNQVVSFLVITLLFAMIFKILPDADVAWQDVWIGAASTALLFSVGKFLLGLYLTHGAPASGFGAAGSIIVVLLWVYYSAQILLFGAQLTRAYAIRFGSDIISHAGTPLSPGPSK